MEELEKIKQYINRYVELTPDEEKTLFSLLQIMRIKKKQAIVQPGFVCKHMSYVFQGALRAYFVDNNGNEHTIGLAIDDWWISDYNSFIFQEPATLFVEAIEPSILVNFEYHALEKLYKEIPKLERFFRIITQRSFAFLLRRTLSNLSYSAEERYMEFMHKYPDIVQRVPQYAVASYLGMSTEYFSKLRNKKIVKKS